MSWTVHYNNIGEGVEIDGTIMQTFYGDDFNPNLFTWPSGWSSIAASNETTSFNLSGFQVGNEVGCHVFSVETTSNLSGTIYSDFLREDGGGWQSLWTTSWEGPYETGFVYGFYSYRGVDDDEIRPGHSRYKCRIRGPGNLDFESPVFSVYNLSFDSSLHDSGYLRVEGAYLCYTDGTGWELGNYGKGYKHKIAYDSDFYEYVGTEYSGKIWLEDYVVRRIYYVDEYGVKRRTYEAQNWLGHTSGQGKYVGTGYKGRIRCPGDGDDASNGYGHLGFVNTSGYLMRILNGNPNS